MIYRATDDPDLATAFRTFFPTSVNNSASSVLVLETGAWYNFNTSKEPLGEEAQRVLDLVGQTTGGMRLQLEAAGLADPCANWNWSKQTGEGNWAFRYAMDVLFIAEFLASNKAKLPRYVFWMDTPPNHFRQSKVCQSDCVPHNRSLPSYIFSWRNEVAGRILSDVVPWVKRVRVDEILSPRHQDHLMKRAGKLCSDCLHYCMGSPGHYAHIANLLTVIVSEVMADSQRVWQEHSANRICEWSVDTLDGFVASGMFSLLVALFGYYGPYLLALTGLLCVLRKWRHSSESTCCYNNHL